MWPFQSLTDLTKAIREVAEAVRGRVSAADQKLLDALLARAERTTKKLQLLDSVTPKSKGK